MKPNQTDASAPSRRKLRVRACMHAWSRLPRGSNNGRWAGPACRPGRFDFDQTIIVVVTEQMCYRQLQTHARVARSRCCSILLYYSNFGTCRVACLTTTVYHSTCGLDLSERHLFHFQRILDASIPFCSAHSYYLYYSCYFVSEFYYNYS
jgi:hypothetical protein